MAPPVAVSTESRNRSNTSLDGSAALLHGLDEALGIDPVRTRGLWSHGSGRGVEREEFALLGLDERQPRWQAHVRGLARIGAVDHHPPWPGWGGPQERGRDRRAAGSRSVRPTDGASRASIVPRSSCRRRTAANVRRSRRGRYRSGPVAPAFARKSRTAPRRAVAIEIARAPSRRSPHRPRSRPTRPAVVRGGRQRTGTDRPLPRSPGRHGSMSGERPVEPRTDLSPRW